jgi:hypothetical protein
MALLCVLLLCGAGAVVARAYHLQITEGDRHSATAAHQQLRDVRLAPRRGTIFDRHGAELAVSVDADSVYANPRQMREESVDTGLAALRLSQVLGVDVDRISQRLSSDRLFVWLERQVTPEEAAAVQQLAIPGVTVTREARRYYPNRELAAHILGFANVDGDGLEGLELSMNERLRGTTTAVPALRDRRGRVVFSEQLLDDHASLGEDVYLTIDTPARRRAGARADHPHVRGLGRLDRGDGSADGRAARDGELPGIRPEQPERRVARAPPLPSDHRPLRARLDDQADDDRERALGRRAPPERADRLHERPLDGRRGRASDHRHAPLRSAHAGGDPRAQLEHRERTDRHAARAARALPLVPTLRFRAAHGHPAAR